MSLLDGYRVLLNENTLPWPNPSCLENVCYVFIACFRKRRNGISNKNNCMYVEVCDVFLNFLQWNLVVLHKKNPTIIKAWILIIPSVNLPQNVKILVIKWGKELFVSTWAPVINPTHVSWTTHTGGKVQVVDMIVLRACSFLLRYQIKYRRSISLLLPDC